MKKEKPLNSIQLGTVLRDKDRRYRNQVRTLTLIEYVSGHAHNPYDSYYCRVKIDGKDTHRGTYIKVTRLKETKRYEVIEQPAAVENTERPAEVVAQ